MKTKFLKYIALPVIAVSMLSCNDWLDVEPKGKIILKTADEYGKLFDNVSYINYTLNDVSYLEDETWINASVISNGWNALNLTVANVLYKTDYDRSMNAYGNAGSSLTFFQQGYERITKMANTILYAKSTMEGSAEEVQELMAQAKLYRAFNYFILINVYSKPYDVSTAASDGGVPLRTDPFIEIKPNPAKSTVAQIYEQIEKDIDEVLTDLPLQAKSKFRFNRAAGYALKAKVHLFKKEWDKCLAAAVESNRLSKDTYDLVSLINPATNRPIVPIYATGEENLFFASTATTYFLIHADLMNLFKQGLSGYGQSENVYDVRYDLYKQPAPAVKDYQFTMQYIPGRKEYSTNSIGLKTTEVMLMMAEVYARKGQYDKVKESLKDYFVSRYRNYNHANFVVPTNVKDAVQMVINERRKELTMGMNRFFDLKRLNTEPEYQMVPTRTIPADPSAVQGIPQLTYKLEVKSPLYIVPFPDKVLVNDLRLTSNSW